MGNDPFAPIPRSQKKNAEPQDDYDPEAGPGYIRIPCRVCRKPCVRQQIPPWKWEHEDDEVTIKGVRVTSMGKYDHEAQPDVLDVEVIE